MSTDDRLHTEKRRHLATRQYQGKHVTTSSIGDRIVAGRPSFDPKPVNPPSVSPRPFFDPNLSNQFSVSPQPVCDPNQSIQFMTGPFVVTPLLVFSSCAAAGVLVHFAAGMVSGSGERLHHTFCAPLKVLKKTLQPDEQK